MEDITILAASTNVVSADSHVLQSHSLEMAKRVRVSAVIGQIPSPTNGEVKQPDADNQPNQVEELSHTV